MKEEQNIRRTLKEELRKMSAMTWKQRADYIWDYYKPLLAAILAVAVLIYTGIQIYQNLTTKRLLYVHMLNCSALNVDGKAIANDFAEYMGGFERKQTVTVDTSLIMDEKGDFQISMASQTKLLAAAENHMIDLMILPEDVYLEYQQTDSLMPLDQILSQQQKQELDPYLVYTDDMIYGIRMEQAPYLLEHTVYSGDQPMYGCVFADALHADMCEKFFAFLWGMENDLV